MTKCYPLSEVPNGETVEVKSISASDLRVKLYEMGITEGQKIDVLFRAPLGDPLAINIGGYVLSMRLDEARLVEVEHINSDQ